MHAAFRGVVFCALLPAFFSVPVPAGAADWSEEQIVKLPKSEKPVHLFNGKDLSGWQGQKDKYFTVQDGIIVAKNGADNAPKASTYLVTEKKYRNFRLIFESKLVTSEMHSGISLWGKTVEREGDPFSYQGHLVMYPSAYGYYDLYRRNSIYKDADGIAKKAGKQHDWNRMEILAIGNRIRHAINGVAVADWSDPKPELCEAGPIGLQLHSNKVAQEVQFRGLILSEDPEDKLVTVDVPAKAAGPDVSFDAARLASINAAMREFVDAKQISGAVTLVAHRGRIVHHGAVGEADIEAHREMKPDTMFFIASMTKPITATAVMILQDEGKLSIEDPVSKYIPEFKAVELGGGAGKPAREITLRDVMTHTSGLGGSQKVDVSIKQSVEQLAKQPLTFQPGTKWQYSPGLTVGGRVVEIVSGKAFEDFLAERIFQPLNMADTTFHPTQAQQQRMALLYKPGEDKKTLVATPNTIADPTKSAPPNPSGGLVSTAADMARFYQMVLNGGELDGKRVVSKEAVRQMTTIQTGELVTGFTPGNGWGLGWCVVREPQGVTKSVSPGTFGHGGAFGTQGWVDPKREMIYVLMIQRTGFGNSDGADIRGTFHDIAASALRE